MKYTFLTITTIILSFLTIRAQEGNQSQELDRVVGVKSESKEINAQILEMEWCGTNEIYGSDEKGNVVVTNEIEDTFDTRLFALTTDGKAYKSNNYGKSWQGLTQMFKIDSGDQNFFVTDISISPVDGKTVYAWGKQDISYMSEQCGKDWKKLTHPSGLFDFRFHRTNKDLILAYQSTVCQPLEEDCNVNHKVLFVSKNGGFSFIQISDRVLDATWHLNYYFSIIDKPGIILVVEKKQNFQELVFTDDFGENISVLQEGGYNFFQSDNFLFVAIKPTDPAQNYEFKIATLFYNIGARLDPRSLQLPFEAKDHLSFTVLTNEGSTVFISIVHQNKGFKQNNIYLSDWRGYQLTISLLNNIRSEDGTCDFDKVWSNEGVFIANTYDLDKVNSLRKQKTYKNNNKLDIVKELENFKKTVISFDNGGNWHPVKAPLKKLNGKSYQCNGDCSLHFVGRTYQSKKYHIYSSTNAPGLIIGIGNVGPHLISKISELNTYLSTDGGHSWIEVLQGPHVFEIGDHGGLIIAADGQNKTNIIKYSWDEGKTWNTHTLESTPFEVIKIITEPNNMEQRFIVSGLLKTIIKEITVVAQIDFTDLHIRSCIGSDHPGRSNSDYQIWIPTNFSGEECVLGMKVKYIRRKPDAACYNQINIEQKQIIEECPCSEEDYECDFGFYRLNNSGECVPMNEKYSFENLSKPPSECFYSFMISRGYKKVPGVICSGGVELDPEFKLCPEKIEEAREEEGSEEYQFHKMQEDFVMQLLREQKNKEEKENNNNTNLDFNSNNNTLNDMIMIGGVILVIGLGIYYRKKLTLIIQNIGEIGDPKRKQYFEGYSSMQNSQYISQSAKKQPKTIRVVYNDDQKNDYEHQVFLQEQEEKPVLQRERDQEEFYGDD